MQIYDPDVEEGARNVNHIQHFSGAKSTVRKKTTLSLQDLKLYMNLTKSLMKVVVSQVLRNSEIISLRMIAKKITRGNYSARGVHSSLKPRITCVHAPY